MLDRVLGLLRIRVVRGVNLAVRDVRSSDPYVVLRLGKQKLKTQVIKKTVNPEWDEELTFSVEDPSVPVKLEVYDKDTFSSDDPMGDAEFDIQPFFEAVKMDLRDAPPDGSVLRKQASTRVNCLAEESTIYLLNGKVVQDIVLRLRNVECGEIELQLRWVDLPSSKSSQAK
ncbi:hypothetical protein IEQ34_021989 [Dendrobium chrysotoxum]|uniref:C2 domain-containing protein n=1 Tax=Dendrobium chrysotoxum TaxID=161865 RepID=A0AAV7FXQ4_DENCH|nr:hypothetical protein IEQ34_021989 [Dendrobium chrysotoxum]